ncbi:YitT family protein (plasmid) [Alkaliphilus sp. B6464]|nr:YitT family protein [Alkaliphilus sp. B6464]
MAISINLFLVPYGLLSGGVSGISLIVQYITNVNSGIILLLLNIPIFLLGIKQIDKDFIVISLVGMISLSLFILLTNPLSTLKFIPDLLASTIYGGLLSGIGSGIVFSNRGSTGGMDIVSVILKKKYEIKISTLSFIINLVIVLIGGFIVNPTLSVYTLISMFISSKVMDKILIGFDNKKMLFVITDKEKEISSYLLQSIKRGVTFLDGEGAYTGKKKKIIYCVINTKQLAQVKGIITQIDDNAFISVMDISEIQGKGFKPPAL